MLAVTETPLEVVIPLVAGGVVAIITAIGVQASRIIGAVNGAKDEVTATTTSTKPNGETTTVAEQVSTTNGHTLAESIEYLSAQVHDLSTKVSTHIENPTLHNQEGG